MKLTFTLLSSLLLLFTSSLTAQVENGQPDHYCGVTESHPWMDAYLDGQIATPRSIMPLLLPLRFIIVGTDEGTGYVNINDLLGSVCRMNEAFEDSNISFFIEGELDTINNTSYWDHSSATGGLMMAFNNQAGVINIYVVGSPNGNCGYYSGSRDAIAMNKDCMGYTILTLAHEVGHFLSLRHTFWGWSGEGDGDIGLSYLPTEEPAPELINDRVVEKADQSNCATAADRFCDTGPDYISRRWSCTNDGSYVDSLIDPNGEKFLVYGSNIMSYADNSCRASFSSQQTTAMEINANSRSTLHSTETPTYADAAAVVQTSPEDGDILEVFDFVELAWEAADNADFYIVEVNNSQFFNGTIFRRYVVQGTSLTITEDLSANRSYYWRVRGVNRFAACNGGAFSEIRRFRNGTLSDTLYPALDAAFQISPNPLNQGQELFIQATNLAVSGQLNYEVINTSGQIIQRKAMGFISATGFRETVDLGTVPRGIYFLRIRLDDRLLTRRIVVQ